MVFRVNKMHERATPIPPKEHSCGFCQTLSDEEAAGKTLCMDPISRGRAAD
jgi:hypothetical protein